MNDKELAIELQKWFDEKKNITKVWERNPVGAVIRNELKKLNHWKNKPRGRVIKPSPIHKELKEKIFFLKEYRVWKDTIIDRDMFCQECNNENGLQVHHIQEFAGLVKKFINQNPGLDINKLIELSIHHAPFWDLNNGVLLCNECHHKKHPDMSKFMF